MERKKLTIVVFTDRPKYVSKGFKKSLGILLFNYKSLFTFRVLHFHSHECSAFMAIASEGLYM